MALTPGTKLGPYEIQSPLGAGGMGEVYRARDTRLDRTVAIKVLPNHLSSSPELKQRFEREARAISSLNHPRICTLHDVGHQDGVDFLVMEHLEGETLADRLRKGPLPLKESLKIGIEVCEALEAAQRAGIVHRDLKPGNIMLIKNGVKLMDFGLAKAVTGLGSAASAPLLSATKTMSEATPMTPLTSAGMVIGTMQYMAPEQIEGKEADARSDLFALGAVLYEMTTGKRPFEGKSQISLANAILEKDPEPMQTLKPLTPVALQRVVSSCLAKNPDDRFQTAHDVRIELEWIANDLSQLTTPPPVTAAKPLLAWLPWAIATIAILTAAAFFLPQHEKAPPTYRDVSYREGTVLGARFSHDGQTIVYGARLEGEPTQIFVARLESPESRPLGISGAEVASISSSDQLAVFLGCEEAFFLNCGGTLATVSLAGGSPRTLAEHVTQADWHPDGKRLVISVTSPDGPRLEFPPGHVLYQQKAGWFGHPRFSPDGTMIAFENHFIKGNDDGEVDLMDLNGKRSVLFSRSDSVEGLAWSPDGKELWCAATRNGGWADTLYAIKPGGKERVVLTSPSIRLYDISKDGRVLLSHEAWRRQLKGVFPGDKLEHPYSWLDSTQPTALSADGRLMSFYESGDAYSFEHDFLAYYRPTDGSPAVRLGVGSPVVSPDGKWVLLGSNHRDPKRPLELQPLGPGQPKDLPTPGLVAFDHLSWSDNGERAVYEAHTEQGDWNVYTQRVASGPPVLITHARDSYPVISPDGKTVALHEQRGGVSLYSADGGQSAALKGASDSELAIRFISGGKSLLVADATGHELVLTRIDLASGHRELWKRIPTETRSDQFFSATPDLKYYAYAFSRFSSSLYVVDNLR
jgi:serine/threonine protein kinase/WD40 repeat protein